jgi:hypothetical protein
MRKYYRYVLILLAAATPASAQDQGIGMGIPEFRVTRTVAPFIVLLTGGTDLLTGNTDLLTE